MDHLEVLSCAAESLSLVPSLTSSRCSCESLSSPRPHSSFSRWGYFHWLLGGEAEAQSDGEWQRRSWIVDLSDLDLVCGLHHVERGQEGPQQGWSWEKSHCDGDNDKQSLASHLWRVGTRQPPGGRAGRKSCTAQVSSTFVAIAGNRAVTSCAGFRGWSESSTPRSSFCHLLPQYPS